MGYGTRPNQFGHSSIKTFWPDDDRNNLYIEGDSNLSVIISRIKNHFGEDSKLEDFMISAEYIHTDCLTYDGHDPSDWTNFLHIQRISE